MTDPQPIDPDRLAALIDGRLSDSEAAAVRRQLANADEVTLAAFADAVAVSRELTAESEPAVVAIESKPKRAKHRWVIPAAAAAAAAIVAVMAWGPTRRAYPPAAYAEVLPTTVKQSDGPVWGRTRGTGDGLTVRARAARIGAVLVDLEVDVARGDSTSTNALALVNLLNETTGGSLVSSRLTSLPTDSLAHLSRGLLAEIGRMAMDITDRDFADAGAYLEAARLATAVGNTTFFTSRPPLALTRLSAGQPPLDDATRQAVATLDAWIAASPRDPNALNSTIGKLLQRLTE